MICVVVIKTWEFMVFLAARFDIWTLPPPKSDSAWWFWGRLRHRNVLIWLLGSIWPLPKQARGPPHHNHFVKWVWLVRLMVSHPGAHQARPCLASRICWDPACTRRYGLIYILRETFPITVCFHKPQTCLHIRNVLKNVPVSLCLGECVAHKRILHIKPQWCRYITFYLFYTAHTIFLDFSPQQILFSNIFGRVTLSILLHFLQTLFLKK